MEDIVKRLRDEVGQSPTNYRAEMMAEAADTIVKLRAWVKRLEDEKK